MSDQFINIVMEVNMKKYRFYVVIIAIMMSIALNCLPQSFDPFILSVSAESNLDAPKSIKAKSTEYSITLSWKKVPGAYKYRVYDYNQNTDKYEKWEDVKENNIEIYVFPGREYKFKIAALKKNGKKIEVGKKSSVISVTSKTHYKYDFPVFTDYGFDRLEPENAYNLYKTKLGSFGAYKDYDNNDSNQTKEIAESFIRYLEDVEALGLKVTDYNEGEYELENGMCKLFSYYVYDGDENVATISLVIYPDNWVLVDLIPTKSRDYPDPDKLVMG